MRWKMIRYCGVDDLKGRYNNQRRSNKRTGKCVCGEYKNYMVRNTVLRLKNTALTTGASKKYIRSMDR